MTHRSLSARLLAPALAALIALPGPVAAEAAPSREETREEARARTVMLGLAAIAALAVAARAAERRESREEAKERALPAACLRAFQPRARDEDARLLHDPACLEGRVERAADLPLSCAVTLRTWAGFETGFDPDCLAGSGWDTVRERDRD